MIVTDLQKLGQTMESLRKSVGKTKEEVAQVMQVSEEIVEKMERDPNYDPEIILLHRYARAVGRKLKIDMVPLES